MSTFPPKINIVIPMAGQGRRFKEIGHSLPKPLIPICGKPMIQWALESFAELVANHARALHFIVVLNQELFSSTTITQLIRSTVFPSQVSFIPLNTSTQGQAETVFQARHLIDSEHPLMIFNCDTYIQSDMYSFIVNALEHDGSIQCFRSQNAAFSYVKKSHGFAVTVAEKEVISHNATTGLYLFSRGYDFISSCQQMIENNRKVKGEFYVIPCYDYLIQSGKKFITELCEAVNILGTPQAVKEFITRINQKAYV